jgi:hypothetical protein
MSIHDEDVLGKAYDARLMRRLISYLRPYKSHVVLATAAIIAHSVLELAPPYLVKLVIDRYIPARDLTGLSFIAALYLATLAGSFVLDYVQTWLLQLTGQRIMFDLRMEIYEHLQRLDLRFYDRNPVGRLMTRVTTDVDVLNDLFTSGVVSVFGEPSRTGNKDFLRKRLAWRIQSLAEGTLSERARRRAMEIARDADIRMTVPKAPKMSAAAITELKPITTDRQRLPIPGTILTRQYHGKLVQVTVLPKGFDYEGQVYRSLSAVAQAVTGAHWSGHLFFGLRDGAKQS